MARTRLIAGILAVMAGLFGGSADVLAKGPSQSQVTGPYERVDFASMERKGLFSSEPLMITGYLLRAGGGTTPVAVLAPSCKGPLAKNGKDIRPTYRKMANHLKSLGISSLMVDGFNPRGREEICTQNPIDRTIGSDTRMEDALAALRFLRSRADVDSKTVFLITWGANGSLEAMDRRTTEVAEVGGGFTAAVMFYPKCDDVSEPYTPYAPVLTLTGSEDAWNPPGPCEALAKGKAPGSADMEVYVYPGVYHGFDSPAPTKVWHDVNAAVGTVTIGGNPEARKDARRRIARFFSPFLPRVVKPANASPGRGKGARFMSEDEVRQTIIGNTLTFQAPQSGRQLFVYFAEDGSVQMKSAGKNKLLRKKWHFGKNDRICRTYGKADKIQCVNVAPGNGKGRFRMENTATGVRFEATLLEGLQLQN